jgi:hypothetical protein
MSRVEQVRLDSGSWRGLVQSFASSAVPSKEVLALLSPLRDANPLDLAAAIDPEDAAQHKAVLTAFVVAAVHDALADHVLCDSEVLVLRQVCRILRVEEGDLLAWQRSAVVNLLSREIQRLLEDDYIDASEALHKAKLQEVLGLNYDEFVALTAPEIDRVLIRLLHRVDSSFEPSDLAKHVHWFRGCVSALDTVYNFNPGDVARIGVATCICSSTRQCRESSRSGRLHGLRQGAWVSCPGPQECRCRSSYFSRFRFWTYTRLSATSMIGWSSSAPEYLQTGSSSEFRRA